MQKLPKQEYTTDFKERAVKRVKEGQSNGVVARTGVSDQILRNWVKASMRESSPERERWP